MACVVCVFIWPDRKAPCDVEICIKMTLDVVGSMSDSPFNMSCNFFNLHFIFFNLNFIFLNQTLSFLIYILSVLI